MNTTLPTHETHEHSHMHKVKKVFWSTKKDRTMSIIVISVIGGLLIFKLGMFVGYHKALFSYRTDARSFSMMDGKAGLAVPVGMPFPGFMDEGFATSHGATGRVISVTLPSFVVASPDNREKTVMIGDRTMIRRFKKTVPATDITTNDFTVVLGEPDDTGNIQAKFIRLAPGVDGEASSSSR